MMSYNVMAEVAKRKLARWIDAEARRHSKKITKKHEKGLAAMHARYDGYLAGNFFAAIRDPWGMDKPPAHWNCRSSVIPMVNVKDHVHIYQGPVSVGYRTVISHLGTHSAGPGAGTQTAHNLVTGAPL
jgi:hypothetical protein